MHGVRILHKRGRSSLVETDITQPNQKKCKTEEWDQHNFYSKNYILNIIYYWNTNNKHANFLEHRTNVVSIHGDGLVRRKKWLYVEQDHHHTATCPWTHWTDAQKQ